MCGQGWEELCWNSGRLGGGRGGGGWSGGGAAHMAPAAGIAMGLLGLGRRQAGGL